MPFRADHHGESLTLSELKNSMLGNGQTISPAEAIVCCQETSHLELKVAHDPKVSWQHDLYQQVIVTSYPEQPT
jgi:hypothetical protein